MKIDHINKNTDEIYLSYSSPKTQSRVYSYNLSSKEKKLVKEQEIPSGHNPDDYIVERVDCKSHDGRLVPLTITRHKNTKLDGSAHLLLYGYGSYGSSMSPGFSTTRLSLINRDIIWVTAHIRGGMERGMKWWKEGKLLNKKNTKGALGEEYVIWLQLKTIADVGIIGLPTSGKLVPKAQIAGQVPCILGNLALTSTLP